MRNLKNRACLEKVKVGDILMITTDIDESMIYGSQRYVDVRKFPVLVITDECLPNRVKVRSHNTGMIIYACGTLVKIIKK